VAGGRAVKTGVHLRLSQQLALTPQLQQSIRLLQLSTIELNQEIEQALLENPLLEREDDPLSSHLRLNAEGSVLGPPPGRAVGAGRRRGRGAGRQRGGRVRRRRGFRRGGRAVGPGGARRRRLRRQRRG